MRLAVARGVEVKVVVLSGGDGPVDLREHGRHPLRRRRRRGQEAYVAAALLEGTVSDEAVEMHVQTEVASRAETVRGGGLLGPRE